MKHLLLPLLSAIALLTSCGSVSTEKPSSLSPIAVGKAFQRVLVQDFTHTVTDDDGTTPIAARKFSDEIANAIRAAKPSAVVARSGKGGAGTLVISGEVTRYMEGNAALRLFIGMGAGSSYFDANVYLADGATGQKLGTIRVDKNSWGLGGGIAATQMVEHFMKLGAKKTAEEAVKLLR
ncbi:MAG: DUF4410 domain-containing protein [Verrucomicrobiaceae bacterium]|nr:DUF4410 domain-containing protein [Verrucomicrobiaceae bacterium]